MFMKCFVSCWCLFYFYLSYGVVLSKGKGRRSWFSVLLMSLRASLTAHFPADDTKADIRLEGGRRGRWSLSAALRPVCMCVPDTCIGLPQDHQFSLADKCGKGSTRLSGSTENLEWCHPAHLHWDPQWEGRHPHRLYKVGGLKCGKNKMRQEKDPEHK